MLRSQASGSSFFPRMERAFENHTNRHISMKILRHHFGHVFSNPCPCWLENGRSLESAQTH